MAFLPHARRWPLPAVLAAWFLLSPQSGVLPIETDYPEPGSEICLSLLHARRCGPLDQAFQITLRSNRLRSTQQLDTRFEVVRYVIALSHAMVL